MWNILEKNSGAVRASLGKEYWSRLQKGGFLDLQEFLEVWPSVKGGGNTKRRWLYM